LELSPSEIQKLRTDILKADKGISLEIEEQNQNIKGNDMISNLKLSKSLFNLMTRTNSNQKFTLSNKNHVRKMMHPDIDFNYCSKEEEIVISIRMKMDHEEI